jgi:outer membrane lipoprotein SlyB
MRPSIRLVTAVSAVTLSAVLAGCGTPDPYGANNYPVSQPAPGTTYPPGPYSYPPGTYPSQPVAYVEYGRIMNVAMVTPGVGSAPANRSAVGGVIGAIVGGLVGNQIGHGSGRGAATVLGAAGGAVVGSNIGRNSAPVNAAYPVYRVTVQVDSGEMRTYDVNATGDLRPGDRVRIENGVIYLA